MAKSKKDNTISFGEIKDFPDKSMPEKEDNKKKHKRNFLGFLSDERFHKSAGILLILFSICLFVSALSFMTSWQADQTLVREMGWGVFSQINPELAENFLGVLGAWLGYIFIYKGFGIASFAFVIIFLSIGILLLTKTQPIPIIKTLKYCFFIVIWVSVLLGFVFGNTNPIFAGTFGYFSFLYLKGLIGSFGTLLLLATYLLIFLVVVFNIAFYSPKSKIEELPADEMANKIVEFPEAIGTNPIENEDPGNFEIIIKEEEKEILEIEEIPQPVFEEKPSAIEIFPEVKTDSGLVLEVQTKENDEENLKVARKSHYTIDDIYDPTLDFANYKLPDLDLLNDYSSNKTKVESSELNEKTKLIEETLKNYNIGIKKISATIGPTVTLYEIVPLEGVRIAKIKSLEDDIALSLAALGIRIIAPIPGKGTIGIEVPNQFPAIVPMKSVLSSLKFQNAEMDLPIAFGKTISDEVFVTDLAKMPHLLMAGATGQGKSVGLNAVIISLLYKKHPSQIKFVLIDPKKVELSIYKTIERHFLAKIPGDADAIITDTKLVVSTLNSLCVEMDDRYNLLKDAQVRNIKEYNAKFVSRRLPPNEDYKHRYLPYIVVVIDELADLMMTAGKEVEHPVARLAQLARAIGIHLILATQRPSVNIITGTIKANFPARLAFRVSSKIDSRTILDANGADQLIGKGDMLFSNGNDLIRLQCAFVDTPEVDKVASFIGNQNGNEPFLLPLAPSENEGSSSEGFDNSSRDDLFEEAAKIIVTNQQGSTSLLQRRLNLGYNRAGRLIDQLEKAGIVGPFKGSKAREVLVRSEIELEEVLKHL